MENASKALIIAGAILLAILIIGLGVFIFNNAKGTISDTGIDEQRLTAINSKFEAYEGNHTSGSDVKALMDLVRTNNNQYEASEERTIKVSGEGVDAADVKNKVATGAYYTVELTYRSKSGPTKGLIESIKITKNS